jgi:plastocyanin
MHMRRIIIIGAAVIAVLFLGFFGFKFFQSSSDHVVVLTETGFTPEKLTIKEGETVRFETNRKEPFWPASNVHPTHTIFPDFDPREPVAPGDSWSFTFTKAGTYKYHDHIASNFEGEIIVERADGTRVEVDCSVEKNQQCWEKLILETLKVEGVKAAFDTIVMLEQTEPNFANDCHGLSHLIGETAYALYVANENFELTPASALCGYGFYHGFMETMLLATGNVEEARNFCILVDEKLRSQASAAATACYHGIGHGTIDGSDPTLWGDPEDMMEPGFKLCESTAENELELYLCDTGVFNAIELLSADPKYGLQEMRKHPFAMCNEQPVYRREGCYSNMMPILFQTYNNDFQKIIDYTNEHMIDHDVIAIDGNTVNDLTTIGIIFEFIRLHGDEPDHMERGIELCRRQLEEDHLACIAGLSGGYIKYGQPGTEYVKNLEFCALPQLTAEERDVCYSYTLPRMSGRYDGETMTMICDQVPVEYKNKYCSR